MSGSGSSLTPEEHEEVVIDLTDSPPTSPTASRVLISLDEEEEDLAMDPLLMLEEMEEENVSEVVHHLGSLTCTIVGIRFYDGVAHPGEFVHLVREPDNVYDRNAIRVDNMHLEKVGHIKATLAKILAPFMDTFQVHLPTSTIQMDGIIQAEGNQFKLPLEIEFFSKTLCGLSDFARVNDLFRSCGSDWNPNPVYAEAIGLKIEKPIEVVQQTIKWETAQENLDQMFDQLVQDQLVNLPNIELPPALTTPLLDHQLEGIRWMYHKENTASATTIPFDDDGSDNFIPFFKPVKEKGRTMWFCEITNATQALPPAPIKGSILADDMGLGKSLQAIGLILANAPKATEPRTTLIVCPLSVISNWVGQIEQHLLPNTLKVGVYHGSDRLRVLSKLPELDVVVAPYGTIAADYCNVFQKGGVQADGKREGKPPKTKKMRQGKEISTVFDSMFYRVILDEAHTIRNIKSKAYAGCMALQSTFRLCLTGTPLQNKPDDIHSLLSFLSVEPLADRSIFRRSVGQPIIIGDPIGLSRLRTVMAHVALRRNKTTMKLVPKTVELRSIVFPSNCAHKRIHDTVFGAASLAFQATLVRGDEHVSKSYMKIIEILMRIRQACISGSLVPQACIAAAERLFEFVKDRELSPEDAERLLEKLKGTFSEVTECAICFDNIEENEAVILRNCSHIFCEPCLDKVSQQYGGSCPLCRCRFGPSDMIKSSLVYETASIKDSQAKANETMNDLGPSPKLKALAVAIGEMEIHEKGVIFSQFTKMLDLLELFLQDEGHTFVRIDGSKSSAQRLTAMREFSREDGGPRFILCSLHAAGTGITLTRGNHCFLMDTWWNGSVEQQAMDRIHRIGQKRPVRIIRFVMKDTIEERMISLQEAKAAIGKGSMEKLKPDEIRKARIGDLKSLFSIKGS